jgi:DNA (cytosine-5)-methyltransferase 1
MTALYNEIDTYAAGWLENLAAAGHIMGGRVDRRSIADLDAGDLAGFRRAHFFAGIAGWDYALQLAGWPADREVWTGSCPCQPFSAAGKRKGTKDARHLWPEFFRLIRARRPLTVMGEQVASADGLAWLDGVCADLEGAGYTVRAADLCAAGVGAPHIRQRLWWRADRVADADDTRLEGRREPGRERADERIAGPGGVAGGVADAVPAGRAEGRAVAGHGSTAGIGATGRLADADGGDTSAERQQRGREHGQQPQDGGAVRCGDRGAWADAAARLARPGEADGLWRDADWLFCRDAKWRPVEPGTFPLADGLPGRVGRLRAYGNAIVPQVAAEFIRITEAMIAEAP